MGSGRSWGSYKSRSRSWRPERFRATGGGSRCAAAGGAVMTVPPAIVLRPAFRLMGVLNVTPDSFSDGGRFVDARAAIDHGRRLAAEGAAIVDVGGESTRPGAEPVPAEEELRRVLPVVDGLARARTAVQISIDTSKLAVAEAALAAGATFVNDVTAFRTDPELAGLVADRKADCCLMH